MHEIFGVLTYSFIWPGAGAGLIAIGCEPTEFLFSNSDCCRSEFKGLCILMVLDPYNLIGALHLV